MIPLRLHSDFSLLKSMVPVKKYTSALTAAGYAGGALTDFDNGFGWIDFFFQMKKSGLKPVLGSTLSLSLIPQAKQKGTLTFLVMTEKGYRNLCLILSAYAFGTLTLERLLELQEDLICLVSPDHPQLVSAVPFFSQWSNKNLFFEIHRMKGASGETKAVSVSQKLNVRCVATQPVFYLNPEDPVAHEVLLSIGAGTTLNEEHRPRLSSSDFYLKSKEEMRALFHDHPEWCDASEEILKQVNFEFQPDTYHIPRFEREGQKWSKSNVNQWLVEECKLGLEKRFELMKKILSPEEFSKQEIHYRKRLEEECLMIQRMRFSDYFLVVADFIQWSKKNGIPVGPGRGSGAGSLAAYCLGIIDIDPVRYHLYFERFLNPERVSMPDFDIDFCVLGRDRVIQYVQEKYNLPLEEGRPPEEMLQVAQIVTFGKMKSKAVIRDVGRVLGIPYSDVDAVAKLVPNVLNITLEEAYKMEPQFQQIRERDPKVNELLQIAERLEGLNRHSSVHAAGVVIADDVLTRYMPLHRGTEGEIVTQFEMNGVEKLGLLKFDFLGLRNLTVIQDCIQLIGNPIDLLSIHTYDPKVIAEISSGDTIGIFQLESSGMRDVIRRLKPSCFEDIMAVVALYRPGPMEMIDDFILNKLGQRSVHYDSPELEPILKETYGVFVYQEQVMKTANVMAGFSLGEADLLRRAMGKKIASEMAKQREKFIKGALRLKHSEASAQKVFDVMAEFANYGFNKSHAAAYAMITMQTAWLKTYYPEAFYAALLSSEADDIEKMGLIIRSAENRGIHVRPPHVNFSNVDFSLEKENEKTHIRFGLGAVKNVGRTAAEAIRKERERTDPFKNYEDFFKRASCYLVNKRQAECVVRSGALDGLGATRSTLFASLESLLSFSKTESEKQRTLFVLKPKLKVVEEWPDRIRLNDEKHLLGTYMSGHPLQAYAPLLKLYKTTPLLELHEGKITSTQDVTVVGLVTDVKEIYTKKGDKMAFFTLEDHDATMEMIVFSDLWAQKGHVLTSGRLLLVKGQVSRDKEVTKVLARDLSDLSQSPFSELHIHLKSKEKVSRLEALQERADKYSGAVKVKIHIPVEGVVQGRSLKRTHVLMETPLHVHIHPELMKWLQQEFGEDAISLKS